MGMKFDDFKFEKDNKKDQDGQGANLLFQGEMFSLELGGKKFDNYDVPYFSLSINKTFTDHSLLLKLLHTNGAFVSYQYSMIDDKTKVSSIAVSDMIKLNDNYMEIAVNSNFYSDKNTNTNGYFSYPLWTTKDTTTSHTFFINEALEHNSKTDVSYEPMKRYDTTSLKYNPKINFDTGSIEAILGAGYSFEGEENIYSFGLKTKFDMTPKSSFNLECESVKSSYMINNMNSCNINFNKVW
jgi:hypothetical protein